MQTFRIAVKDPYAQGNADDTRAALDLLAKKFSGKDAQRPALSKEIIAEMKGSLALQPTNLGAMHDLYSILWRSYYAAEQLGYDAERSSYILEGAISRFRKEMHQAGRLGELQEPTALRKILLAINAPAWTSAREDSEVAEYFRAYYHCQASCVFDAVQCTRMALDCSKREALLAEVGVVHVETEAVQYCGCGCGERISGGPRPSRWALGVYREYWDEKGEPYVAGLLSPKDVMNLRFRRIRLGSYLAELGYGADQVRTLVNQVKAEQASAKFVVYPNDCPWGVVYVAGRKRVGSCMTYDTEHFDLDWTDAHPVDAYSSAYWGKGDNNLALITQVDDNGDIIGRGIMNVEQEEIVRWYGNVRGMRAMERAGVSANSRALYGSWLALITDAADDEDGDAGLFLHPYIDGAADHGEVSEEEGRVYLGDSGQSLCDTDGYSSVDEDCRWCEFNNRRYRAQAMTYLPIGGHWIRTASLEKAQEAWTCPITGEWAPEHARYRVTLDGEVVNSVNYLGISTAIRNGDISGFATDGGRVFSTIKNEQEEAA